MKFNPFFTKVQNLIHKEWNTSLKLQTDEDGRVNFRGFCGDYSLLIKPESGPAIGNTFKN
jgi:hypothetical protein